MREMVALLLLASVSGVGGADSNWNSDEPRYDLAEALCGINEYTECLKVSKSQCIQKVLKASENCPSPIEKSRDLDLPDPVCVTKSFIEQLGLPDSQVQKCDSILGELLKLD